MGLNLMHYIFSRSTVRGGEVLCMVWTGGQHSLLNVPYLLAGHYHLCSSLTSAISSGGRAAISAEPRQHHGQNGLPAQVNTCTLPIYLKHLPMVASTGKLETCLAAGCVNSVQCMLQTCQKWS
jgi:hypothetical protein